MKKIITLLLMALVVTSCSGFLPSMFGAQKTSPEHLSQFLGGGSMSTLWYIGSGGSYHYFDHFVKVKTRYKVLKTKLKVESEFSLHEGKPILARFASAELSTFWRKRYGLPEMTDEEKKAQK